jgi:hypothetical protein
MDTSFQQIWSQHRAFKFDERSKLRWCAPEAELYQAWAEDMLSQVQGEPSALVINQALLDLTHKWADWRALVAKAHRDHASSAAGLCLAGVFWTFYERLRQLSLNRQFAPITPEVVPAYVPPRPPKPSDDAINILELDA